MTQHQTWWRHQMETFSALLAICAGNSPVPVNSPHKGQWRGALMFSLICVCINGWINNREAGDLRRYRVHYVVIVMRTTHTQNSPIDCDGVQLTNAQCHMVPISILWYRESWTIQLKCTFETKQERIVSYYPTHHRGHTNFWYVCLSERAYFNHPEYSYTIWYVYNEWSIQARSKVVRRKHIIQPTGFGAYSPTCF